MKREKFERSKWMPIFIVATVLIAIYMALNNIPQITAAIGDFLRVISPLLYGILFTYFLYFPHRFIEKMFSKIKYKPISKRARGISTLIMFAILVFLISVIISVVFPIVIASIVDLGNALPQYIADILNYLENIPADSVFYGLNLNEFILESSEGFFAGLINAEGLGLVADFAFGFFFGIFNILLGLVISLYILLDRERIADFSKRLNAAIFTTDKKEAMVAKYFRRINKVLLTFIASKGLDSLINFTYATVALFILNVPYALLLGLIAGAFNFIPYLGSAISAVLISAVAFVAVDWQTGVLVLILLLIFNQLDGNYIEPRIMKSSLKISPILVIISVVAGGAYFNVVGMFLAVPFAVIIKETLLEYIATKEHLKESSPAPDISDDALSETIQTGEN